MWKAETSAQSKVLLQSCSQMAAAVVLIITHTHFPLSIVALLIASSCRQNTLYRFSRRKIQAQISWLIKVTHCMSTEHEGESRFALCCSMFLSIVTRFGNEPILENYQVRWKSPIVSLEQREG